MDHGRVEELRSVVGCTGVRVHCIENMLVRCIAHAVDRMRMRTAHTMAAATTLAENINIMTTFSNKTSTEMASLIREKGLKVFINHFKRKPTS